MTTVRGWLVRHQVSDRPEGTSRFRAPSSCTQVWTEDRIERLQKMWADGLSASIIAGRLGGVSRNAVIGKAHRMGLSGRPTLRCKSPNRRKRQLRIPVQPKPKSYLSLALKNLPPPDPYTPHVETLEPLVTSLADLPDIGACKFPIGDDLPYQFCGRSRIPGTSYCEHHCRVAYAVPVPRRRAAPEDTRPKPGRLTADFVLHFEREKEPV